MAIRKKNKKKDSREKKLDEDKELLLEARYIPVSDRVRLEEEGGSKVTGNSGALRAHKPILEVS